MNCKSIRTWLVTGSFAFLAACGGDGGGEPTGVAVPAGPATVGAMGGTVAEPGGATVVVPAGAIETETTIRVAMDSTGAPALPAGLDAAGNTYVITPHGGEFAQPVEVRIPAPNVTLRPNQELRLAKAQPGGEWQVLLDSELKDGVLSAQVSSFSFFVPVKVDYALPVAQTPPLRVTGTSLNCGDQSCDDAIGTVTATYTVTTNSGQLPASCTNGGLGIQDGAGVPGVSFPLSNPTERIPLDGGSVRRTLVPQETYHSFRAGLRCEGLVIGLTYPSRVYWRSNLIYPRLAVLRAPAQLDVVDGLSASLDVVLAGGATKLVNGIFSKPTQTDRAVIDWQRSDDNGALWRVIDHSYQDEANPNPLGDGYAWRYWSVRHSFIATAADQGALMRVRACYTPPDVPAPRCPTGPPTRLNVLQQSALPALLDLPRAVLVKTGQTASFSATASGAPVPTLQWQTRAANATGAWLNVSSGTGGTSGSYTTGVLSTADNGTQLRVVASNAQGSAPSAAVTVSVSDLDVAPTITTQPASLGVTAGNDAAFAIAARGTEALSYQWQFDGTPIVGANSPVLRLPAVAASRAGSYRVVVSNAAGSITSDAALLAVSAGTAAVLAPTIVTQPVSVLVNTGNTATFAVGASGSSLSYQWKRDNVDIPAATAAFYSIASTAVGDAATYAVVVSNSAGIATSFNVRLTVNAAVQLAAPSISTQPATLVVAPGGAATLAVAASGSGPLSYQWRRNGVDLAGATGPVLTLTGITSFNAGSYSVFVGNPLGGVESAPAEIILLGAPVISRQPAAAVVTAGTTATFAVGATGDALRYQWVKNSLAIDSATSSSYTTPPLVLADNGAVYSVIVYNGAGLVFSTGAVLTVNAAVTAPSVTLQPPDRTIAEGESVYIEASFGGTLPLTFELQRFVAGAWRSDFPGGGAPINNNNIAMSTGSLVAADSGAQFRIVASNAAGSVATNAATVTVTPTNAVAMYFNNFDGPATVAPGVTATLTKNDTGTWETVDVQGFAGLGPAGDAFAGNMLRVATATTVTLTLNNLPPHSALSLGFLFAAIDSLDGGGSFPSDDRFYIRIVEGDILLFQEAFENAIGDPTKQSYGGPAGVQLARRVDLGFGGPGGIYTDSAYNLALDWRLSLIGHTASSVSITFVIEGIGAQALSDESWGMDNLRVLLHP